MHLKRIIQILQRKLTHMHLDALTEAKNSLTVSMPSKVNTACMNFMIDFELIWGNGKIGSWDHLTKNRISNAQKQCENFTPFIELIQKYNFPTSWAILGKLGKLDCEIMPDDRFQPAWCRSGDWYSLPGDPNIKHDLIYGERYIKAIQDLTSPREILSHGFAHIDYADEVTSKNIALKDLQLSLEILNQYTQSMITSFVYPCNKHGHKEILKSNGINVIRGEKHHWKINTELIETPLGFWISPGAMSFKELLPFLEQAVEKKSWIHPWMHLIECDLKTNDIDNFYRPLLEWSLEQEAKGKLIFSTFSNLPKLIQN